MHGPFANEFIGRGTGWVDPVFHVLKQRIDVLLKVIADDATALGIAISIPTTIIHHRMTRDFARRAPAFLVPRRANRAVAVTRSTRTTACASPCTGPVQPPSLGRAGPEKEA